MRIHKKELLKEVMYYVCDSKEHNIDEVAIEPELDRLLDEFEYLAERIEKGEFDLSYEDMKAISEIGGRRWNYIM